MHLSSKYNKGHSNHFYFEILFGILNEEQNDSLTGGNIQSIVLKPNVLMFVPLLLCTGFHVIFRTVISELRLEYMVKLLVKSHTNTVKYIPDHYKWEGNHRAIVVSFRDFRGICIICPFENFLHRLYIEFVRPKV